MAVIVVGVLAGAVGCSQATQQTASPATVTGSSADPRPATTQPAATSKRRPGVLWQRTSSDLGPDRTFEAPARWRIVWSFDCRSFASYGGGNFKVSGDGAFQDVSVQQVAVKASGTRHVTGGGRGRLVIESVCDRWIVTAVAP